MRYADAQLKHAGARGTKGGRGAACDGCFYVKLQLIFRDGAVEGLSRFLCGIEIVRPVREVEQRFCTDQAQRSAVDGAYGDAPRAR